MKKILILSLSLLLTSLVVSEAAAQKKEQTKKDEQVCYAVNIDCGACQARIEESLPYERGIKDLDVNLEGNTVTVRYNPTKTDSLTIKKSLEKLDFQVERIAEASK